MENVKTSGSDGFKCEFYKFFRGDIKQHVITSINYSLEKVCQLSKKRNHNSGAEKRQIDESPWQRKS